LGLRLYRSKWQTDEHPGVYRHAGTGAGLRDGREPQALRPEGATHGCRSPKTYRVVSNKLGTLESIIAMSSVASETWRLPAEVAPGQQVQLDPPSRRRDCGQSRPHWSHGGRVVNMVDDAPTSIYELIELAGATMASSAGPLENPWSGHADGSRARSLGFQPTVATGQPGSARRSEPARACIPLQDSPRETLANLSITGHLRGFSDQPVAEIVQCGEPTKNSNYRVRQTPKTA
jgi:hypothetical protein